MIDRGLLVSRDSPHYHDCVDPFCSRRLLLYLMSFLASRRLPRFGAKGSRGERSFSFRGLGRTDGR